MSDTEKPTSFKWNEETSALAIKLYNDSGKDSGPENMKSIVKAVGCRNTRSLVSKLSVSKVYVKPEVARKVGGATAIRKSHLVKQLAEILEADFEDIESAEKMTRQHLENLISALGEVPISERPQD